MTDDFFRSRLDQMIDMRHPLVVLSQRLPWAHIEAVLAPSFARKAPTGQQHHIDTDLFGPNTSIITTGANAAGRPRLPIRLMAALLYLKHAFSLSDEALVERWSENVVWQYFSGLTYYTPQLPCDATQIGRFRAAIGEAGVEELLKATMDTAVQHKAIALSELERVIVDTTVQEKAIAHPVDSRLLEIARHKLVKQAKRLGMALKQTYAKEGKTLRRRAGGYAHAKQFRRLKQVVKRQRTILGVLMREVQRKMVAQAFDAQCANALGLTAMNTLLERIERLLTQKRQDKNKLYALHAPEVECIGKGKARKPYEFGVKTSVAITHKSGLMVGARTFPGNPYDGHILSAQLEQVGILLQDTGKVPKEVFVDLGFRGVDADNPNVEIIHRGKAKSLTTGQWRLLKRRQAIEPSIGHLKADHRMDRCWLWGQTGDALHAVLCAAGYNIRWLMRAALRLEWRVVFLWLQKLAGYACLTLDTAKNTSAFCWMACGSKALFGAVPSTRDTRGGFWVQMNFAGATKYIGRISPPRAP